MFEFLKNLFTAKPKPKRPEPMDILRKTGSFPTQQQRQQRTQRSHKKENPPQNRRAEKPAEAPQIEDGGPGKNILQRTRFIREDTGTHETLKIVDENGVEEGGEAGIDPYNTGQFDRSKTWGKHFNK